MSTTLTSCLSLWVPDAPWKASFISFRRFYALCHDNTLGIVVSLQHAAPARHSPLASRLLTFLLLAAYLSASGDTSLFPVPRPSKDPHPIKIDLVSQTSITLSLLTSSTQSFVNSLIFRRILLIFTTLDFSHLTISSSIIFTEFRTTLWLPSRPKF